MKVDFKSKKNLIIFILIGLFIIIGIITFVSIYKNSNSNVKPSISYSGDSSSKNVTFPTKENISFEKAGITKTGDFIIKVTNNNNSNVALNDISTIFKDSDGNFVEKINSSCSSVCIPAHSFTYIYNWGYYGNMAQYENYDFSYEIIDYMENYIYNGIEFNANDTGKQISVTAANNSGKDIDCLDIVVLFYSGDEIVGIQEECEYKGIQNGTSCYLNVDYPKDSQYNKVSFDKYEIYYVSADIQ